MDSKDLDKFEKPFSELCIISEDEKTFQGEIRWNIPNGQIKKILDCVGSSIWSNTFSIGSPPYCSFYILFYPNGRNSDLKKTICVSINFNRKLPDSAWIRNKIHLGDDVCKTFSVSAKSFGKEIQFDNLSDNVVLRSFVLKTDLDIILYCSVKISLREVKCEFDKEMTSYSESRNYDSNKETFKQNYFSDVTISINGYEFKTHKTLLARIPYFQKLFDANESERHFELTNIEDEIFNHILTFLYSGDIPKLYFKLACELYIVANDLQMFDLKNLCSSYLGANLTESNVVMILKFSHEYQDIALKRECFKFIKKSDVETLTLKSIVI